MFEDDLLDEEGYPTEDFLNYIKSYNPFDKEHLPIMEFVEVLERGWHFSDWGFKLHRKYRGKRKLELHTGGWSGNEETIRVIKENVYLSHFKMKYVMWRVGGHHYFEIEE